MSFCFSDFYLENALSLKFTLKVKIQIENNLYQQIIKNQRSNISSRRFINKKKEIVKFIQRVLVNKLNKLILKIID